MSGITSVIRPADTVASIDAHPQPQRDGEKQRRRPRPKPTETDQVEKEIHTLDLEV